MKKYNLFSIFVIVLLFVGCNPAQDDAIELSAPPSNVGFDVVDAGTPNTYILKNTTDGTFMHQWDLGNGVTTTGAEVEVYYPLMGSYEVTLRAFNDGGFGESTKIINVAEDDQQPCVTGSLLDFLTDCDSRTWKMKPDAGAYWVGNDMTTYWTNTLDDVTTRFCAFDDEWTFNTDGEMIYDTKGDLWAEDYMGYNFECIADGQLQPNQAAWGSATHNFVATEGPVEQLQVLGLGAFIGLPKAANGTEVTEPQQQVTYDIIDRGMDANGLFMEIEVNSGGGLWRFILVAD